MKKPIATLRIKERNVLLLVGVLVTLSLSFSHTLIAYADVNTNGISSEGNPSLETQIIEYEEPDLSFAIENSKKMRKQGYLIQTIYTWKAQKQSYQPISGANLLWEKATVYKQNNIYIVNVPLDAGLDIVSSVAYVWANGRLEIQETFARMESENQVHAYSWIDGTPILDTVVVNNEMKAGAVYGTKGLNWGKFNNCLSSKGVNWATITVIGLICSGVCAGTAGAGCVPCLFTASTVAGGTIGYCVGQAWK